MKEGKLVGSVAEQGIDPAVTIVSTKELIRGIKLAERGGTDDFHKPLYVFLELHRSQLVKIPS